MIKVLCIDVDCCLTDGKYIISSSLGFLGKLFHLSWVTKTFNTRDFDAIEHFPTSDTPYVIIITSSIDNCLKDRIKTVTKNNSRWNAYIKEGTISYFTGIKDKKSFLHEWLLKKEINWGEVAYMGDSSNDLSCMRIARLTACPADASIGIKENSNYISDLKGGEGCIADFINYIIKNRGKGVFE